MSTAVRLIIAQLSAAMVLSLLNVLVLRRITSAFRLSLRGRRIVVAVLLVPFVGTLVFRGLGAHVPIGYGESVAVASSAAELGVFFAASFFGAGMLVSTGARRIRAWRARSSPAATGETNPVADAPPDEAAAVAALPVGERPALFPPNDGIPRRAFVEQAAASSVLLASGGSAAYGALFGRHDYELSTVPVPIPGLSKAADGFTIVQLSDIHLGQMVGESEMRAAEELVRRAKGDLIVLTGDLIDHDVRYTDRLGRLVRRLSEIRPVVAIPGNHDYYTGIDHVLATVRGAGATMLVNQASIILGERDGFVLAGLDDPWGGEQEDRAVPDLAAALAGVRSEAPRIVLCHNPKVFRDTAGQVALQISGHTHGGQVNLGVRPADLVLRHGYVAGLYKTNGSHIYVNRGFGTAGPAARVGAPPEVSRIVLVAG